MSSGASWACESVGAADGLRVRQGCAQTRPARPRRIKAYLDEVCELEDPRARGKGLTGDLAGYWRYRIGDYRVLVFIDDRELVIVAVTMGHRSGVY